MKLSRLDRGSLSAWNSALRSGLGLRVLGSVGRFWVRFSFWVWVDVEVLKSLPWAGHHGHRQGQRCPGEGGGAWSSWYYWGFCTKTMVPTHEAAMYIFNSKADARQSAIQVESPATVSRSAQSELSISSLMKSVLAARSQTDAVL